MLGSQAVPPDGFRVVLRHALTVGVPDPEVELGAGFTLLGGQTEPPDGFRVVLRYALTVVVHDPEEALGVGVSRSDSEIVVRTTTGPPRPVLTLPASLDGPEGNLTALIAF